MARNDMPVQDVPFSVLDPAMEDRSEQAQPSTHG
jgi:hypothetical protein